MEERPLCRGKGTVGRKEGTGVRTMGVPWAPDHMNSRGWAVRPLLPSAGPPADSCLPEAGLMGKKRVSAQEGSWVLRARGVWPSAVMSDVELRTVKSAKKKPKNYN